MISTNLSNVINHELHYSNLNNVVKRIVISITITSLNLKTEIKLTNISHNITETAIYNATPHPSYSNH